jgi:RNA polymerase sigma factor (TIGR02999 family)
MSAERSEDAHEGLLRQADGNDPKAVQRLFELLYRQLKSQARREAHRLGALATAGTVTVLHEAYLVMSQRERLAFRDEAHFLAYAARVMRGIVIDRVRERHAQKRGGHLDITALNTAHAELCPEPERLAEIGDALDDLARDEPELAQVVELKFFCGFSMAEIAALHKCSERTVHRQWEKARLLLFRALQAE